MIPTAPLRLRNRLSEAILRALGDAAARGRLAELGADPGALRAWLGADGLEHGEIVRVRARRAAEALAACPLLGPGAPLDEALAATAVLFDAGLHFEVHELLEPYWVGAAGAERHALQGLIQVAVGYQHLANGNLPGAGALLTEGSARLRAGRVAGRDLVPFADAVAATVGRLPALRPADLPRLSASASQRTAGRPPSRGGGTRRRGTTWISS